jgi:hypothetical protein
MCAMKFTLKQLVLAAMEAPVSFLQFVLQSFIGLQHFGGLL